MESVIIYFVLLGVCFYDNKFYQTFRRQGEKIKINGITQDE